MIELPDPRRWPPEDAAPTAVAALHRKVQDRLALTALEAGDRADAAIDDVLVTWLQSGDARVLAAAFDTAPSADVHRHLWRRLAAAEAKATSSAGLAAVLFALPVVLVTARESPGAAVMLPDAIADRDGVVALLRAHGIVDAQARIALAPTLAGPDSIGLAALPALVRAARSIVSGTAEQPLGVAPAPVSVEGTAETVHLRFLVGLLLAAPGARALDTDVRAAGMPLTRLLSRELAMPGVTVLALCGKAARLVDALAAGRAQQRQVAFELFTTNAVRRLRASFGEPTATVSAHEAHDAPGGGELRVSLASPFGPRDAEGFRYPLQPYERVPDAVAAIVGLLRDCRVGDVRGVPAVHPDRDAATGLLRFCRADDAERSVH